MAVDSPQPVRTDAAQNTLDDIRSRAQANPSENVSADIAKSMEEKAKTDPAGYQKWADDLYRSAAKDPSMKQYIPEIDFYDSKLSSSYQAGTADAGPNAVKVDQNTGVVKDSNGQMSQLLGKDGKGGVLTDDGKGHISTDIDGQHRDYTNTSLTRGDDGTIHMHQPADAGKNLPEITTDIKNDGTSTTTMRNGDNATLIATGPEGTVTKGISKGEDPNNPSFELHTDANGNPTKLTVKGADGKQIPITDAKNAHVDQQGNLTYDRAENGQTTHVTVGQDGKESLTFTNAQGQPGTDPSGATSVKRDAPGGPITEKDYPDGVSVKLDANGNMTSWTKGDVTYNYKDGQLQETKNGHEVGPKIALAEPPRVDGKGELVLNEHIHGTDEYKTLITQGDGGLKEGDDGVKKAYALSANWNK